METGWNLWHGCHKISEGCKNCYVYRRDSSVDRDASQVLKTQNFNLPVKRSRGREYKIPSGSTIWTCFTSDFFIEEADEWRVEAWKMIRERSDCSFIIPTKRIERMEECLPSDWGDGYDNVTICCTVENQKRADQRLPVFLALPIKHRQIYCEPLLEKIDIEKYLDERIEVVAAGGESGFNARVCDFDWIKSLSEQARRKNVGFHFHQTGARFVKDGKLYKIERKYQHSQARKAKIDYKRTDGNIQLSWEEL